MPGQVTFKQSATLVAYVSLAYGVLTIPLMLLILFLKGDWNLNPQEIIQANPTLFLDRESVSKALWAFAGSLDLVVLWQLWLLATAFAVATGRRHRLGPLGRPHPVGPHRLGQGPVQAVLGPRLAAACSTAAAALRFRSSSVRP